MNTINIKDIARICGVGISTVSRVLNDHPDVSAATKSKILRVIKEYNYIPNNSARNLRLNNSRTIAVIVKGISNLLYMPLIKILQQEITKHNYTILLHPIDPEIDEVDSAIELIKEKNLKGIIFVGGYFYHDTEQLQQITVPFVIATTNASSANLESYSSVCINDVKESYKAVDYLCHLGHRNIAILIPEQEHFTYQNRLEGYKRALRDYNIPLNKRLIFLLPSDYAGYTLNTAYSCISDLMTSSEPCTAIFAASDIAAIAACKAILDIGKSVPKDYSVIGFDDLVFTEYLNPPITSISHPTIDIGTKSVEILFELIDSNGEGKHQHIFFPCTLVDRKSCSVL